MRFTSRLLVLVIQLLSLVAFVEAQPPSGAKIIKGNDGAEMVLVPAGKFWMGSDPAEVKRSIEECKAFFKRVKADDKGACASQQEHESPRHQIHLDAFYLDRHEVTNALYKRFMQITGHTAPSHWNHSDFNGPSQPVVGVTWHDAAAYCRWAGKRLPTEAEWEKAARGLDGSRYPWGSQWDSSRANSAESHLFEGRPERTLPVGSYPTGTSPYGAHDLAGNVKEWVADAYEESYYKRSPERNPTGPSADRMLEKVVRGGSWSSMPTLLRAAARDSDVPDAEENNLGFRCAKRSP